MSDSEMTSDILLARPDFRGPIVWRSRCAGGIRMIDFEIFLEMVNIRSRRFSALGDRRS